jgi:hypothetical protein
MRRFVLPLFVFVSFQFVIYADEPVKKTEPPKVPVFKQGEEVYLTITSSQPKWSAKFGFKGADGTVIPYKIYKNEGDYLVYYRDDMLLVVEEGDAAPEFSVKKILDDLQKKINDNPINKADWRLTHVVGDNSITITFAGIRRLFYLKSIRTPNNSRHRKLEEYVNKGKFPGLRLRIDKNGEYQGYVQSKNKSWNADFSENKSNQIEVREWKDDSFLFRLRDWNTYFKEYPITEFSDIKYEDLSKGTVVEKLDDLELKDSAITLEFQPVKP